MSKPRLLVVEDNESLRKQMKWSLAEDYAVQLAENRAQALSLFLEHHPPVVTLDLGLPPDLVEAEAARYEGLHDGGLAEPVRPFDRPVLERLTRRAYRDVAFRRQVREAYGYRCAMSGLMLRNGGGRPEVQAAHIRPVDRQGSDSVRNGLALSGTLHWMFDRGLISVADDCRTILVSRNKVPGDVVNRLLAPGGVLLRPQDPRNAPHPENLRWHRENVFGQVMADAPAPWDG